MKEVIYTCIFLLLLIILGVLVFFMFGPGKAANTSKKTDSRYTPGIYRTSIQLNNNSFDLEVAVDADRIRSIHLANLSESTSAMFPLVEPVLDEIKSLISEFMQYEIREEELDEMIRESEDKTLLQTKLKDVKVLYQAFREYLSGHFMTAEEVLENLQI